MRTEMDVLVLENCVLLKEGQPPWPEAKGHVEEHELKAPVFDPVLLEKLRALYHSDFASKAAELRREAQLRVSTARSGFGSLWNVCEREKEPEAIFSIPEHLDRQSPDPGRMARAMSAFWAPGTVTGRLTPLLEKLFELGLAHPAGRPYEEAVSDSLYVLF
jgi:carbamoyltransferase